MVSIHDQKCICGCSPRTGTLLIGWFNFIVCTIPFVALIVYANEGAIGLDGFLYDKTTEIQTRTMYLYNLAELADEDAVLKSIRYRDNTFIGAPTFLYDLNDTRLIEKKFWEVFQPSSKESNEIEPAIRLVDIDPSLAQFFYRFLFAFGLDSSFALISTIIILGVGVTFNGLLLIGAHSNFGTPIAFWLAEQIFIFILDLSFLVCIAIYSGNPFLLFLQCARISFSFYCIVIVNRHHHSLYGSSESKSINTV